MAEVTLKHIKKVYPNTEKKSKKGKKAKAEPKKEEERISLMPSKKELKRAEALRREKQREEAMRKKQGC